ncbi:MAG: hypothetical protein FWB99_02295 [Treponema sp.]|nr:hypothetical protein [Treponema sp.]
MKAKKRGILAITAAAVFMMTLLMTNCADPVNPTQIASTDPGGGTQREPAPGMGFMRLEVMQAPVLLTTLRPDAGAIPALDVLYFTLALQGYDGFSLVPEGTTTGPFNFVTAARGGETLLAPFPVAVGGYTVTVQAFNSPARTEAQLVAVGSNIVNVLPAGGSVSIPMLGILDATSLIATPIAWNIPTPVGADAMTMTITALGAQTVPAPFYVGGTVAVDIYTTPPAPVSLQPGFYEIVINASGPAGYDPRRISRVIHVFQNMPFTANITVPALNTYVPYVVTFDRYNAIIDDTTVLNFRRNQLLTDNEDFDDYLNPPPNPTSGPAAGAVFMDWYTTPGFTAASVVNVADFRVRNTPMTLYARWVDTQLTVTLSEIDFGADLSPTATIVDVSRADLYATSAVNERVITIDLNGAVASTVVVTATDLDGFPVTLHDGSATFTLNFWTTHSVIFGSLGQHIINISVTGPGPANTPWSGQVVVNVTL